MKTLHFLIISLFFAFISQNNQAQTWSSGKLSLYVNPSTTNVGIGTAFPKAKLDVNAASGQDALCLQIAGFTRLNLNANGGLAIGSNNTPSALGLYVYGNTSIGTTAATGKVTIAANNSNGLWIEHTNTSGWSNAFRVNVNRADTRAISVRNSVDDDINFIVYGNGVVNTKKIYSEAFEVTPNAFNINWFDHVFNEDYNLMTLSELEEFIKTNKHLPDIPSETKVKSEGFDLAEMNGLLLKKVEELTLYVIQQQKEIEQLKSLIK